MFSGTIINDSDIKELITCSKTFRTAPSKPMRVNKNISTRFSVYGEKDTLEFQMFITHSERMPQDFSLGLMYDNMLLYRCNGFHGTTKAGFYSAKHHAYPHAHMLSVDDIKNARGRDPSTIIDLTGKYVDERTAISFFCEECGIIGYERYFPVNQLRFDV